MLLDYETTGKVKIDMRSCIRDVSDDLLETYDVEVVISIAGHLLDIKEVYKY